MRKGEQTREHILAQAAGLFNTQGYAGASMADVMAATGLQKGGIYRHFGSKEELALEAFDYAVRVMGRRFAEALEGRSHAVDRLRAVVEVYRGVAVDPPVPGGCPVMNAAIDADDGNPALRERARAAMEGLRDLIERIVERGKQRGQVRGEVDGDALASIVMATLEGGVMLSRLYGDPVHVDRAVAHLSEHLERSVRAA